MKENINKLREYIIDLCSKETFIHHNWYVKYHLEIVEKISLELCEKYPEADKDIVLCLVWFHDFWKIIDKDNEYDATLIHWIETLEKLWFDWEFSKKIVKYIEIFDEKVDIKNQVIEIQIVSSADWAAHLVGPFYKLRWYENPNREIEKLMKDNIEKSKIDRERKIVLKEVKDNFLDRYNFLQENCWIFPEKYI